MDFKSTGLPMDKKVYKAYGIYSMSLQDLSEQEQDEKRQLRAAQLLAQTTTDKELIALPLLFNQSESVWDGPLINLFGDRMIRLKDEILKHSRTQFRDVIQASDEVKLFYIAQQTVHLEISGGQGIDFPEQRRLWSTLRGKTSSPELEKRYIDTLNKLSQSPFSLEDDLSDPDSFGDTAQEGLPPEVLDEILKQFFNAAGAPQKQLPLPPLPSFDELPLAAMADYPEVRAAYAVVCDSSLTRRELVFQALTVAEILAAETENPDPVTIAAALLDVATPGAQIKDVKSWEKEVGAEVVDVLLQGSVHDAHIVLTMARGSERFKQIGIAISIMSLEQEYIRLEELAISKKLSPQILKQEASIVNMIVRDCNAIVKPALGTSGSLKLEQIYIGTADALSQLIAKCIAPVPPKEGPPPPPTPDIFK